MAIAHVQTSAFVQSTGASSISPSLTGVTSGNSLLYFAGVWHSSIGPSTPTNYTEAIESASQDGTRAVQGHRHNAPSGTNTPSIGLGSGSWVRACLIEYSGMDNAAAEATNSNGASSNSASSGAVTPGGSDSLMTAMVTHDWNPTITPTGGWSQRAENEDSASGQPINIAERTGVTGSQTATWTLTGNTPNWAATVASYAVASAGATSFLFPRRVSQRALLVR